MDQLDISSVLTPADTVQNVLSVTVTQVYSDGTVDVDLGGNRTMENVPCLSWYTPSVGDAVEIVRRDIGSWLVLGTVLTSAQTTVSVAGSWTLPYNVKPLPAPPPNPPDPPQTPPAPARTHKLVVQAVSTHSWRNTADGWDHLTRYTTQAPYVYQGAYTSYIGSADGYWMGCYFYGSAFDSIRGTTCVSCSIHLVRRSSGGQGGPVAQYIAPHAHKSMPSGRPLFTASASNVGSLAWGRTGTFSLPRSFGQQLCDGTAHGFGHRYSGSASYSINGDVSENPYTGAIVLYYK